MKKNKLMALAAATLAVIGGGTGVSVTETPLAQTTAKAYEPQQPVKEQTPATIKQIRNETVIPIARRPYTGGYYVNDMGRSPKEYGQYLQATGRQKWVKSKRA